MFSVVEMMITLKTLLQQVLFTKNFLKNYYYCYCFCKSSEGKFDTLGQ